METIIDKMYNDGQQLLDYLSSQNQLSFKSEAENNFRKNLLLSAASYFEKEVSDTIVNSAKSHTNDNALIVALVRSKVVARQYHTYFDWDQATNANKFFSLFGEEFKCQMAAKVKYDINLNNSIKSFLEIGAERNKMVHQNYAEIVIDKTAQEIFDLYKNALYFIDKIKCELIKQNDD